LLGTNGKEPGGQKPGQEVAEEQRGMVACKQGGGLVEGARGRGGDRNGSGVWRKRGQEQVPTVADKECLMAEGLEPMGSNQVGSWSTGCSQGFVSTGGAKRGLVGHGEGSNNWEQKRSNAWGVVSVGLPDCSNGKVEGSRENSNASQGQEENNGRRAVGREQWWEVGGQRAINNADQMFKTMC